jgi:2-polyprenyl-3-methyl-5-hydroxy-6-metoxy-1,4-benzoquinol methylase
MRPIDIATSETHAFIQGHLPFANCRLLEVGCGGGALAQSLRSNGVDVLALDISEKSVEQTKARGVKAICGDFLTHEDDPFDVVFFSRSLHHILPLNQTIAKAHALTKANGIVLVEDFAYDQAGRAEAAWRYHSEYALIAAGVMKNGANTTEGDIDPMARWLKHHLEDHQLADSKSMEAALQEKFTITHRETAPYLYRYLVRYLQEDNQGASIAQRMLNWEKHLIAIGQLKEIGLRFVAIKKD